MKDKVIYFLMKYRTPIGYSIGYLNILSGLVNILLGNVAVGLFWVGIGAFLVWDVKTYK